MGLSCGLIGLPNVGKTSVYNALVGANGVVANYPFSTVGTQIGASKVPDVRLSTLSNMFNSKKVTPSTLEVRDIAGLVPGASAGEGLGNQFLAEIREVDALLHLVRCFHNPDVTHVVGEVDPLRDIHLIENELFLADLSTLERRRLRIEKRAKSGDVALQEELAIVERFEALLQDSQWLYGRSFSDAELKFLQDCQLLTTKPVIFVANVSEGSGADDPNVGQVIELAKQRGTKTIVLCGKIESEIAALSEEERQEFFQELGLKESGLQQLIALSYQVLGIITFFTAGEEEARAWTIVRNTKAAEAAGKIHSDMQRGFIRAEVYTYEDAVNCGSLPVIREKGLLRLEGRDYVVKDGDVMFFRFNV